LKNHGRFSNLVYVCNLCRQDMPARDVSQHERSEGHVRRQKLEDQRLLENDRYQNHSLEYEDVEFKLNELKRKNEEKKRNMADMQVTVQNLLTARNNCRMNHR